MVDLRSDTVTKPTPAMRQAMMNAEVGDDVFGDDPTVNALQAKAARLLGKEAGLFVPTGTMGNEIAIKVHTKPGDAILTDDESHIVHYELGGPSALSMVLTETLRCVEGTMDPDEIRRRIRVEDDHTPGTALLCIENTHNRSGGRPVSADQMAAVTAPARECGVKVHMDGARLFNAAVALLTPPSELARHADSVMFCLSKGLGCPVGSLLVGSEEFITKAHRVRKLFGGGMRQVGVLAACGLVALDTMIDRLAEDHRRAKRLAEAINDTPGWRVDLKTVRTNMIYAHTEAPAPELERRLKEKGVLALALDPNRLRFVTHHDIDDAGIDEAIATIRSL